VLDCGCVSHKVSDDEEWWSYLWLHEQICKVARECLGVDYEKAEVEKLKKKGYNVKVANVETMDLGRTFDVVVAGELIEHLANPGLFLERANKHLKKDGMLILTTPNVFSPSFIIRRIFNRDLHVNEEHVAYYDVQTLNQLLTRYNFELEDVYWHVRPEAYRLNFLIKFRRDFAPTIIAAARKLKDID
jgi:SAM-dependent methyltransferase